MFDFGELWHTNMTKKQTVWTALSFNSSTHKGVFRQWLSRHFVRVANKEAISVVIAPRCCFCWHHYITMVKCWSGVVHRPARTIIYWEMKTGASNMDFVTIQEPWKMGWEKSAVGEKSVKEWWPTLRIIYPNITNLQFPEHRNITGRHVDILSCKNR